jgi:hypothetical protein
MVCSAFAIIHRNRFLYVAALQISKEERIWIAAEAGDKAKLQQYLVGASADELRFEERDFSVSRVLQHVMWRFKLLFPRHTSAVWCPESSN